MPATRHATLRTEDLPDVINPQQFADWQGREVRSVRAALRAGEIPGAHRCGQSWRVVKALYLAGVERGAL